MILSEKRFNEIINAETILQAEEWDQLKSKLQLLDNNQLREFVKSTNNVLRLFSKMILSERKAIKL